MTSLIECKEELQSKMQKVDEAIQVCCVEQLSKNFSKKMELRNKLEAVDKQIVELSKKITKDIECEAFLLKYIHGYSLREISRTMHYDRRYVCRLLAQARKEVEGR